MTTPKTNGNGAKEVAAASTTTKTPAVPKQLTEAEKAELEAKARLEAQRKHFDGLYKLTTMRERYQEHKDAVERITIDEDEMEEFENDYSTVRITIGNHNNKYEIRHPYLVQLTCEFLAAHFNQKIAECENNILNYGK